MIVYLVYEKDSRISKPKVPLALKNKASTIDCCFVV
jgi:hypothetical protein